MNKSNEKDSSLIKRKEFIRIMKARGMGVYRISPNCFSLLENYIKEHLEAIISMFKEEISIKGRKTPQKKEILEI